MCITFGVSEKELKTISRMITSIKTSNFPGYKSLQDRKESREAAWRAPGWDECVAYTVPLIREMHCRILRPTSFSPTQ